MPEIQQEMKLTKPSKMGGVQIARVFSKNSNFPPFLPLEFFLVFSQKNLEKIETKSEFPNDPDEIKYLL
jgi:hypothetical protein